MTLNIASAKDLAVRLDPLTGLSNRIGLEACLAQLEADRVAEQLCLLTVNLSRFGNVNDSLGSTLGDKIISVIAKRLQKIFQHATLIAHRIAARG